MHPESNWQERGSGIETQVTEVMFNMLNALIFSGMKTPMVGKILVRMAVVPHGAFPGFLGACYLLERMRLRDAGFQPVGLRIAFHLVCQPAFARMYSERSEHHLGYR